MDSHPKEHIFHVALKSDWDEAVRRTGVYAFSTRGLTLDEVGFIHCSFRHQVEQIRQLIYGDVLDALVVLEIDPSRLHSEVRVENVGGGDELFPHIYGPLPVDAVVGTW